MHTATKRCQEIKTVTKNKQTRWFESKPKKKLDIEEIQFMQPYNTSSQLTKNFKLGFGNANSGPNSDCKFLIN